MVELQAPEGEGRQSKLRYKIFLGIDIVGSTAFKQPFDASTTENLIASERRVFEWQRAIESFYRIVNARLLERWGDDRHQLTDAGLRDLLFGEPPRIWKTVGDEILFWKQIDHELQIVPLLAAWFEAIDAIRKHFQGQDTTRGLDVKATVWSAEFPYRNRVTATGDEDGTDAEASAEQLRVVPETREDIVENYYNQRPGRPKGEVDFIGPGIDVGFRISTRSTSKKMAISVDVAYLLACVGLWYEQSDNEAKSVIEFTDEINSSLKHNIQCNNIIIDNQSVIRSFIKNKLSASPSFSTNSAGNFFKAIAVYFSGTSVLKGALGNVKYPFLWISTSSKLTMDSYLDSLYIRQGDRSPLEWRKLYSFCRKFYDESGRYVHPPLVSFDWKRPFSGDETRVSQYQSMIDDIERQRSA